MERAMKKSDIDKAVKQIHSKQHLQIVEDGLNRARSITVGTAFGGTIEMCMRIDGRTVWAILQPVEALELAHQIAAAAGCHIAMRPREDFGSWREWKAESSMSPQFPAWSSHPPSAENTQIPRSQLPLPEKQPGMKTTRSNKNAVATKKTVNGRSAKRTASAA